MTTLQTEFTEGELLEGHDVVEPVIVDGLLCHGGFLEDGTYVSPRTRNRAPAIEAWERQRLEQFSTPLLEVPFEAMPPNFPSVDQSKFLLRNGVPEPTIAALTRIGTLEGFAGMLRLLPTPDYEKCFEEDITGTAIAHIANGLFEAHARDESGYDGQAGHDKMWFKSRDIAFENPLAEDENAKWLSWLGLIPASGNQGATISMKADEFTDRVLPDDVDGDLELVATRMIGLLFIEVWAFHSFDWASGVLSDTELVAGEGSAATLVEYIRRDESPHIAWLRTALSEIARPDLARREWAHLSWHRDAREPLGQDHAQFGDRAASGQPRRGHGHGGPGPRGSLRRGRPPRGDALDGNRDPPGGRLTARHCVRRHLRLTTPDWRPSTQDPLAPAVTRRCEPVRGPPRLRVPRPRERSPRDRPVVPLPRTVPPPPR